MKLIIIPILILFLSLTIQTRTLNTLKISNSRQASCFNRYPNSKMPDGFCPQVWAKGLSRPRGIWVADNNDVLVVEARLHQVTALWDDNNDGISDITERAPIATAEKLNHGIEVNNGYLYASNPTTVFRWPYNGTRSDLGQPEIVIQDIPCCHHITRTIRFDSLGLIYVQSGSGSNVDQDSSHSQIRVFDISDPMLYPIPWNAGNLWADGLRNEVGIRFDKRGVLWGVENGVDNLNRDDLGGDIHTNNPTEEYNRFDQPEGFYGYPYCWSEGVLDPKYAKGLGTQWAQPDFMDKYTDEWCRKNSIRPVFGMQAHYAPMDIIFNSNTTFARQYADDSFVSVHGSWNRKPAVGYRVLRFNLDGEGVPTSLEPFLEYDGDGDIWPDNFRPVGLGFAECSTGQCLYVSNDSGGEILEISDLN
eukprot:TRINITY_DN6082_c0_g1_i1.p1 TRINITY_DN6082_c0_g1~~TRINITY_DN6082_c0_g1_i1.p1  ORF type:complete len:425 (-),score=89.69 TRINITY_DN6082_c0_g1_i1:52-1305(-)